MLKWTEAYNRVSTTKDYAAYFGRRLPMDAFRYLCYSQRFEGITGAATAGTLGPPQGPVAQNFPAGAIILGITAGGFQAQQAASSADYAPSFSPGRRDLFALSFQYSNNEQITPNGLTMAEALLGSGWDTIFPAKELLIPPSSNLLAAVAALFASSLPTISVHVAYHAMVPRV